MLPLHTNLKTAHFSKMNTIVLIVISAFLVAGFLLLKQFSKNSPIAEEHHDHTPVDGVCCGKHTVCDKGYDNLYFDDEELDRFKGREQGTYTDEEIEEFRQVLYTMKSEEIDLWVHCLQTRGIELPSEVKDEVLLMLQ